MKKQVHSEIYKEYEIFINAQYRSKEFDWWQGKETEAVTFYYHVFDKLGNNISIEHCQIEVVYKDHPKRFLFRTIKPSFTFKEKTEIELRHLITYIKSVIDRKIYEREMTEGLLESLK